MTGIDLKAPSASSSEALFNAAEGFLAQSFNRSLASTGQIMIGGVAYGVTVPLYEGQKISNIYTMVSSAGATMTLFKAGIMAKDGSAYLGKTADQSALFTTGGLKKLPLITPWTVTKTDIYVVPLVATATTLPQLWRGCSLGNETKFENSLRPYMTIGTGLTDLPAVPTAFGANSAISFWVGVN